MKLKPSIRSWINVEIRISILIVPRVYACLPLLVFHPEVFYPEFDGFDDFTVLTWDRYDIETHATKGKSNKYVLYYHSLSQVCYCFEVASGEATLCHSLFIEKS